MNPAGLGPDDFGNLKFLIEYNGEQHYKFCKIFHKTEEDFNLCQYRDKLKNDYCINNGIILFTIKYIYLKI